MRGAPVEVTLPAIACTAWCSDGTGHTDAWHPIDQSCMSGLHDLDLTAMPLVMFDGKVEGRDSFGAYLIRDEEGGRTRLQLVHGDVAVALLTLDEARRLRDLLNHLIARSTRLSRSAVELLDADV